MNLVGTLMEDKEIQVIRGKRWLCGEVEQFGEFKGERYFVVYKKGRKKPLTETTNEDEALRFLVGEKG